MIHKCDICNYTTERNQYFLKHIETEKHKVNIKNLKKVKVETTQEVINDLKEGIKEDLIPAVKKVVKNEIKTMEKRVINKVDEVKNIAVKNKEMTKTILNRLNEDYKDNPPLEYLGDYKSLKVLQHYYKLSEEDLVKTNKLQKAIVKDYVTGDIVKTIINILTGFLRKDNLNSQSIFNTDTSRHNYAAKHRDAWKPDKQGLYLNDRIIKPFCVVIASLMKNYLHYKAERSKHYRYDLLHKYDDTASETDDDIFLDRDHPGTVFENKDNEDDEHIRFLDECEEVCNIRKLIRYIETDKLYDEIIAKLSPILNYNIRIINV